MEGVLLAIIAGLSIIVNGFLGYLLSRPKGLIAPDSRMQSNHKLPPPKALEEKKPSLTGFVRTSSPPDSEWTRKDKANVGHS